MAIAILSKNHRSYLEAALDISKASTDQLVTFQSRKPWAAANKVLQREGPGSISVYFAVNGADAEVEYWARLEEVVLRPSRGDASTDRLLDLRPASTMDEDLWSQGHGTLYAVSGCCRLEHPISYTNLRKKSDSKPVSSDYKYSYAVILDPRAPEQGKPLISIDIKPPPPSVQTVVIRRIRDAALVRRLKALYDHRCQRCDTRLQLADGSGYSEGHHLRPLGGDHEGPDHESNVVILCPNCHALLDLGAVILREGALTTRGDHVVDPVYIRYHNSEARKRGAR